MRVGYLAKGRGRLKVSVVDTGVGIPAERRDRLFQRFSQVDGSVSRTHGGTGLGLVICKNLVELMSGKIGVTSDEGAGATFWFTIDAPVADASAADLADEAAAPEEVDLGRPAHILIVDDLAVNRELVRAMLTPFGHSFEEADNGADAVRAALQSGFDLILMDLQMPGMDGFDAARTIRATSTLNRATPIIALSANVLPAHIVASQAAGMDDHLGNPIVPAALAAKVAMWAGAEHEPEAAMAMDEVELEPAVGRPQCTLGWPSTRPCSSAVTTITEPSARSPARSLRAITSTSSFWITRLSGRAP